MYRAYARKGTKGISEKDVLSFANKVVERAYQFFRKQVFDKDQYDFAYLGAKVRRARRAVGDDFVHEWFVEANLAPLITRPGGINSLLKTDNQKNELVEFLQQAYNQKRALFESLFRLAEKRERKYLEQDLISK